MRGSAPKGASTKSEVVCVRVTPAEKVALAKIAGTAPKSLRRLINEALRKEQS